MEKKNSIISQWTTPLNSLESVSFYAPYWAELFSAPSVVIFSGELGSGKTTIIQHILAIWGISRVKSPTFDLVHHYQRDDTSIWHADLYRVRDFSELEVLELPSPDNKNSVVLAEWGTLIEALYSDFFQFIIAYDGGERHVTIIGQGDAASRLTSWSKEVLPFESFGV